MTRLAKVSIVIFWACLIHLCHAHTSPVDFVAAHNKVRETLGLPPVSWNDTVAGYALKYAGVRSADCAMVHSGGPYGENIAEASWEISAAEAVKLWADEVQYYNYEDNSCAAGQMCGHYTQLVWRDSVTVGCATAKCQGGDTFVTCNYDPPGNFVGERPY